MVLGTTYIFVSDIKKSLEFYSILFQENPIYANDDRWVQFSNKIALYNKAYDAKIIGKEPSERFNQAYIDDFYRIIKSTEDRQGISLRSKDYFKGIMDAFKGDAYMHIARVNVDKFIDFLNNEI